MPEPVPALVTKSVAVCRLKVNVTFLAPDMVTVQVLPEKVSQPDCPQSIEPAAGVAVRVTLVFCANGAEHEELEEPQDMPAGALVTVPLPLPVLNTVSAVPVVCLLKVTVTDLAADMVTVQVKPLRGVQPNQLASVEPASGVAVRVTLVFSV